MRKFYLLSAILLSVSYLNCQSGDNTIHHDSVVLKSMRSTSISSNGKTKDHAGLSEGAQRLERVKQVKTFLQSYLKRDLKKGLIDSMSRQFQITETDLNNDGRNETFVGLNGPYFCGSGGCTFLLLNYTGSLNTRFTIAAYPLFADSVRTNGWCDLLIQSNGKLHRMRYTGVKYPSNPSVAPIVDFLPSQATATIFDSWGKDKEWYEF